MENRSGRSDASGMVVIGDSNLKEFTQIPRGWEVHCLPGAKLQHVNNALEDMLPRRSDKLSIVYVPMPLPVPADERVQVQVQLEATLY